MNEPRRMIRETICQVEIEYSTLDGAIAHLQSLKEQFEGKMTPRHVKIKGNPRFPWKVTATKELLVGPWEQLGLIVEKEEFSDWANAYLEGYRPETYEEAEAREKAEKFQLECNEAEEKRKYEELKKKWG